MRSATNLPEQVDKKLQKELEKGRIAGPFDEAPFEHFKVSPLSIREKQTKGQYRLLHNLSFPYDKRSVNGNIPKEDATVQYSSVSEAVKIIRQYGKSTWQIFLRHLDYFH